MGIPIVEHGVCGVPENSRNNSARFSDAGLAASIAALYSPLRRKFSLTHY